MQLELSDEQLNKVVQGAVLQLLSEENRVELISKAIGDMMNAPSPGARFASDDTGKKETMIQWVMDRTLHSAISAEFEAYWKSDKGKAQVKELVAGALARLNEDDKILEIMGNAVSERLRRGY
jgi:hypothetical protein